MFFVDSHCHIDLLNYHNIHLGIEDVLEKSIKNNIKLLLTVSTSINNFNYIKSFIKNNKRVLLSCGIHPLHLKEDQDGIKKLHSIVQDKRVISIGETGLDYYHGMDNNIAQQLSFRKHIYLANKFNKPLLVHTRCAINDTIKILKEEQAEKCIGVIHSCTEDIHAVRKLLNMGFYISFSGIITFKNSDHIRKVAQFVPLDKILLETDSPYLAPIPHRGKENQPAFLYNTALVVSKLKKIDIEILADSTTKNFFKLFHLEWPCLY
ncbi:MAG: YchF/TatD family DNA exonuclease [Buchnera aphidicola (Meitanaphis elongallis)]